MSITYFENEISVDDWLVSFDKAPQAADKVNVVNRLKKRWEEVRADLDGLGGLKLTKPDFDAVADALIKSGTHAVIFTLVLTKSEFRLDLEVDKTTFNAGKLRVPSGREEYRNLLSLLNGWSTGSRNIVPDADFRAFNDKHPKKPTEYKDYDEMAKKSKADVDAFRKWSAGNSAAKAAFAKIDKTAKAKPSDPARAEALKAINAALKEYYKSFD